MASLEEYIKELKKEYTQYDLMLAKFMHEADLTKYEINIEKFDGEEVNMLNAESIKFCTERFEKEIDMFKNIFSYSLGESEVDDKIKWAIEAGRLEHSIEVLCKYCKVDIVACPYKVVTNIDKYIDENNLDQEEVYSLIVDKEKIEYNSDKTIIDNVLMKIVENVPNETDYTAASILLRTNAIKILPESYGDFIKFRHVDFTVKTQSFFDNLLEYYRDNKGIDGEINLTNLKFENCKIYGGEKSPFEIAAYIKYLLENNNLDFSVIDKNISSARENKIKKEEKDFFKKHINQIKELECSEDEKQKIIDLCTYIRNYNDKSVPYIHWNMGLFTKNDIIAKKIIDILKSIMDKYKYIPDIKEEYIDVEIFAKKISTRDEMISKIEDLIDKKNFLVFENINKIKTVNEKVIDGFFTAIKKFSNNYFKSTLIFIEDEEEFKKMTYDYPEILNNIINFQININSYDIKVIKEEIINEIEHTIDLDEEFSDLLEKYIEKTYDCKRDDEDIYVESVSNKIIYAKYNQEDVKKILEDEIFRKEKCRTKEEILEEINSLTGIAEAKDIIKNLVKYMEYTKKVNINKKMNLNMLFKGNSGTGKTTLARLMAELFYSLGYLKKNKLVEVTSKDLISTYIGETEIKTQKVIESALDGVLFIDEAYNLIWQDGRKGTSKEDCIITLLKALENYTDRLVIIFAGYTKEMSGFLNLNQGLSSRIGHEIEFSDFTQEELLKIFNDYVKENDFTLENGVEEKVTAIIIKKKAEKNFGNARYVKNLFDKLVLVHAGNCSNDEKLRIITNDDITEYDKVKIDKTRSIDDILKDLNSLIGLEKVKETVNGFVSVIELNNKLNKNSDFNMHMIFKGNAGTGKTTVARLIAEIYYNLGYIKKNKVVEVIAKDLIGGYVGHTGPKTQAVIESALDGVLFIDEAYSLMNINSTYGSFSQDCIVTLLKALEDYKGRLIIIFAGYKNDMERFRDYNQGLRSRIGFEIEFEDYSIDELLKIYDKKSNEKGYKSSEAARIKVKEILGKASKSENFGNGRFVDNLIQKIIIEHAKNTKDINEFERLITIEAEDVKFEIEEKIKSKIGFNNY